MAFATSCFYGVQHFPHVPILHSMIYYDMLPLSLCGICISQIPHYLACLYLALQAQVLCLDGANEEVHHPFILRLTLAKLPTFATPKALPLRAQINKRLKETLRSRISSVTF